MNAAMMARIVRNMESFTRALRTAAAAGGSNPPAKEFSNNNLNSLGRTLYCGGMDDVATVIAEKYRALSGVLNESTLRLQAAVEARGLGRGGVSLVYRAAGFSRTTL